MSRPEDRSADYNPFDALRGLLDATRKVVDNLAGDPQRERLLTVFNMFPPADREMLLRFLEREANYKLLEKTMGNVTGIGFRPNPKARFYVRVIDEEKAVDEEPAADHDRIVLASLRAMRMVHNVIRPIYARWKAATLDALRALEPEERATIAQFNRDFLRMVEEVDHAPAAATA
jgi:hypothetical protein